MPIERIEVPGWIFYIEAEKRNSLNTPYTGKWTYFFNATDLDFADKICKKAVEQGVVAEAKHTDDRIIPIQEKGGVCCFYCDGRDTDAHKRVITFFLENNMIQRTK